MPESIPEFRNSGIAEFLRPLVALIGLVLGLATGGSAQVPLDSIPPDSIPPDTFNTTAKYLKAQEAAQVRLPTLPNVGVDGPRPAYSRIVLERDSIDWATAETVGELIQRVPGVYLWRGGWYGREEYPDFRGRGPSSVEYFLDGLPYLPVGPDSTAVDPSLFSLSLFSRIEIDRWPGSLRVYLFTRQHDRKAPASRIAISSGDKGIARYIVGLQERSTSGLGFGVAGERFVAPTATGDASDFDMTQAWLQASFVKSERFGVVAQLFRTDPDRKPYQMASTALDNQLTGRRNDIMFRTFWQPGTGETGPRFDLLLGRTSWSGDAVDQSVKQAGLVASWRQPTLDVTLRGFVRSRWTPADLDGQIGWAPTRFLALAGEGAYQSHDSDPAARWAGLRASLNVPLGFTLAGAVRTGRFIGAPSLAAAVDSAQNLTDWQATLGWQQRWAGFELGYAGTDRFQSQPYWEFTPTVPAVAPSPSTRWVTLAWRLAPVQWFTLQGWYSDPVRGGVDGIPPTHSMTTATIRSKFWRSFRSGIFDLKAQFGMEAWSKGTIGRDAAGQPIVLPGATFYRSTISIQLDKFQLYWDRVNLRALHKGYVPGFEILRFGQTFGVRWDFLN
jgi:hypothetical protein